MSNEVRIVITADGKQAVATLKGVGDEAEKSGSRMGGLLKPFGDVAKIAGGFVIGSALTKLPGVMGGAMNAASALNETLSKSNTVFKESGPAVEAWANTAAKAFGQSKQQALEAAGGFGNLFVQLGIGKDAAAKMSMQMTELASDFASFHNADITEVITAQSAAFRGEYDALQRFVPTINAAAVEQEALAQTGKTLTKELTVQEKALAVQALMMKGAGDAMGDFGRTAEGAANKQRILDARMADLSATIGQKLLPVKVALMGVLLDKLIPAFETAWRVATDFGDALADRVAPVLGRVRDFAMELAGIAWDKITGALSAVAGFVKDIAGAAWDKIDGPLKRFAELYIDFAKWEIGFLKDTLVPALKALGELSWDKINEGFDRLAGAIDRIAGAGQIAQIQSQIAELSARLASSSGDAAMWADAWQKLREKLQPAIDALRVLTDAILVVLIAEIKELWRSLEPLVESFKHLWESLKPLHPLLEPLAKIIGVTLVAAFAALTIVAIAPFVLALAAMIVVVKAATLAIEAIATTLDIVTAAVKAGAGLFKRAWENVIDPVVTYVGELPGKLRVLGEEAIDKLRYGAQAAAVALMQWFKDLPSEIIRWIGDLAEQLRSLAYTAGQKLVSGVIDGFRSKAGDLASALDPRNIDIPGRSLLVDAYEHTGADAGSAFVSGALGGMDFGALKGVTTVAFGKIIGMAQSAGDAAGAAFTAAYIAGGGMIGGLPAGVSLPGGGGIAGPGGTPPPPGMNGGSVDFGTTPMFINGQWHFWDATRRRYVPASGISGSDYMTGGGTEPGVHTPTLPAVPGHDWQFNTLSGKWELVIKVVMPNGNILSSAQAMGLV